MAIEYRGLSTPDEVGAGFRVFLRAMVGLPFRGLDATELTEPGRSRTTVYARWCSTR